MDILINNAALPGGISPATRLDQIVDEQVIEDINIKVVGYLRTARAVAPHLIANGWGRIINIGGLAVRKTVGRIVDAREVAWVVTFLASPRSVAINGDSVVAGGGSVGPIYY
ncbi:SDR family NAD(P)-dependent oxidoreductase [Sorangium sp. So ce233]